MVRSTEQRADERKSCFYMPIDYASDHHVFTESIHNISASGAFIETGKALPAGTDIHMVFTDYDRLRVVKIPGKVIRTTEYGIGVRFLFDDHDQKSFIQNVMLSI